MHVLRSAGVVTLGTLASRVLGLVRDVVSAALVGTAWVWDAFIVAFTIPNLLRRLLGEGALSAAFIPVFAQEMEDGGRDRAMRFFNVTLTALVLVLVALLVLALVATVLLPTDWFAETDAKAALTVELLRIMLPYMVLVCVMALLMGVLNSLGHFFTPAVAPAVLNFCWIAGLLAAAPLIGDSPIDLVRALAVSVLVGGVLQLAVQIPALRARGVPVAPSLDLGNPAFRRMLARLVPVVIGLAPVQLNVAADRFIAEFLVEGDGANSYLFYGMRLMQLPVALIGIAIGVAVFPAFSRLAAAGKRDELADAIGHALKLTLFLALPAAVGLAVLAKPLIALIYQHGRFDAVSTTATAEVLLFYAVGVFATCGLQVVTRAFYAAGDMRTPVKVGAAVVVLNLGLNLALVWSMRWSGLALATSVTAIANLALLTLMARRKLRLLALRPVLRSALASLGAALACGAGAGGTLALVWAALPGEGLPERLVRVVVPVAAGGAAFVAAAHLLRMPELRETIDAVRRREPSRPK
jgi:putative peptidoglycan lipid II flippase